MDKADDFLDAIEMNATEELFNRAAQYVESIAGEIDATQLLEFYGLYKQGTVGKCNIPKPNFFNLRAQSKWHAWYCLEDLSQNDAMNMYVQKISELYPNWNEQNSTSNSSGSSSGGGAGAGGNGSGSKKKRKPQWISVSTHQQIEDDNPTELKCESEKTGIDCVKEGNITLFLKKIDKLDGQRLNKLDADGMSLIHWIADRGNIEMLESLLKRSGVDVNQLDCDGQTALHYAASCGHLECVKLLIKFGGDRTIKDKDSLTCSDVAFDINISELLNS